MKDFLEVWMQIDVLLHKKKRELSQLKYLKNLFNLLFCFLARHSFVSDQSLKYFNRIFLSPRVKYFLIDTRLSCQLVLCRGYLPFKLILNSKMTVDFHQNLSQLQNFRRKTDIESSQIICQILDNTTWQDLQF